MSLALTLLVVFFIFTLIWQKMSGKNFCAMCISVSLTWLVLLFLYFSYGGIDPLTIGILMGGSAVGFIYYLFRNDNDSQLFKFPFLITVFWLIYIIISAPYSGWLREFLIIGGVWVFFVIIYVSYKNEYIKGVGRKIIECCRNW